MSVYLIQAGVDGPIKIGHSNNPRRRLHNHQLSNPQPCRIIAVLDGGAREEAALHKRFAADLQRGEWFTPSAAILEFAALHPALRVYRKRHGRPQSEGGDLTVDDIVDELGGTLAVAKLARRPAQAVSNWRVKGKIPSNLFLVFQSALALLDINAPPSLWGMEQVA